MTTLVRLGDVCYTTSGGTPSRSRPEFFGGAIPWVKSGNLNDGVVYDIDERISAEGLASSSAKIFPAGTLLIAMYGATVGKLGILDQEAATNQAVCGIQPNKHIDRDFLFHCLLHKRKELIGKSIGGAQPNISQAIIRDTLIPLPPLDEQRWIVGLLDRAAEIRRRADTARAKARAIIPALFLDMFGDPATNPKGWPVVMIGEAGEVKLGRQRAPKYQSGKFTRPYVRVANVFENMIDVSDLLSMDFDERDYANYRLSHGDILLNEGQSIELVGRPAMWRDEVEDCCFQNTLVRFRCDPAKIVPDFALAAFLRMYRDGHLSKIASKTSNVAHLGAGRFGKLPIVLPPIRLQTAFAEQAQRVDSLARHLDAAAAKAEAMAVGLSAEVIG